MKTLKAPANINHPAINECLVYDLETSSLDPNTGKIRYYGAYSYKHGKFYLIDDTEPEAFMQLWSEHKIVIGYNNKDFDNAFLAANGFDIEYKIVFDCLKVLYDHARRKENRSLIIETKSGQTVHEAAENYQLREVCRVLEIPTAKGDIDYKIFHKETNTLTKDERSAIETYLYKDIKATKELFEFYVKYFETFSEYVPEESIKRFRYIRSSTASYSYDAICNLAGLPAVYPEENDELRTKGEKFKGATVLDLVKRHAKNVIIYDFTSLYPHCFIQGNLLSPKKGGWSSPEFFKLAGEYDTSAQGKIETVLHTILRKRIEYKKAKDPRQLALKILLNSFYGLCGNPIFMTFYNETTSPDCCTIGRKCLETAKEMFESIPGCTVIYGDTDSCFVEYPIGMDRQIVNDMAKKIVEKIQSHLPFAADTWKLGVDNYVKEIWFEGKKNYCYITEDGKLKIKGLSIIKNDASALGKKFLETYKPRMVEQQSIKFSRANVMEWIQDEIKKDTLIIAQTYKVKHLDKYKSKSCIHAQIAAAYGEGEHQLVPNTKVGKVGKGKKYCLVEEAKTLSIIDLVLDKVYSEIEPFISETYINK